MDPANILKIDSLNANWRDKDSLLLHACFQILKDFVENEDAFNSHIDWAHDERHRAAKIEILALNDWWLSHSEKSVPEEKSYELENQMLHRLIDVRWALWT